ncbi:MAG: DUF4394 domain-containing protein [Saprospiraceae bacterium]|nr:DUF4394 domain-containing protein [Saprospiraceae bacterium]MBK7810082.1 DUF4394 domain-containing protein [Saprospiraceae bacterium]MBK9629686.1 DUF4394 domain-containing protein [Saprospiraceae bacterium]
MKKFHFLLITALIAITSCTKEDPSEALTPGPDQIVFAINTSNELIRFNAKTPASSLSKTAISGLVVGEKLMSIDFRPSTGELYALSDSSKLYIINQNDGKARIVGASSFTPKINGNIASIDFNPTVDRLRLVTSTGQNLRLNPETATVAATDGAINGGTSPIIAGIAYTNSKAGATSTILYDIDQTSGKLYTQNPPNNGTLVEVGNLGITFTGQATFDITPGNIALMAAGLNFYILDLTTGKASKIGSVAESLLDIAIPTDPIAYATDASNNLLMFNPSAVSAGVTTKAITGLQVGENVLGIDFRPLNGQLFALGSSSRLYTINLSSGAATQVGTGIFSTLLLGTDFGFDFNPTVDRIRVVSNLGQNLRLNPVDGTVAATDGNLNPGLPIITAAAYTNNFAGTTATSLFVVDHNTDKLYIQNPPNNGTLVEIGNLGIDLNSDNGFDIGSRSNNSYLIAAVGGTTNLYTINTSSGLASTPVIFPTPVKGFSLGTGF